MKEIVSATAPGSTLAGKQLVGVESVGVEALVPRDQWDRPLILPATGHKAKCEPRVKGGCKCMVGYTRVSTMAETLSDSFGLARFQKGNVVKGMAARPDLVTAAKVIGDNKSALYEIVDLAEGLGDNKGAAMNGTTFHRVIEMWHRGEDTSHLPENLQAMLAAAVKELERIGGTILDTEQFVVQDRLQNAGTYDAKIETPDGVYIGDWKTGQNLKYQTMKVTMQVADYASSSYYDIGTHEREPLGVDRDRGLLMWCPWVEDPKDAECEARWLDLKLGRKMLLQAEKIRDFRKLTPEQIMPRVK